MPYKREEKYVGQVRRTVCGKEYRKERKFLREKDAIAWEVAMRDLTDREFLNHTIHSAYSLLDWNNDYLFHAQKFSAKTLDEKKSVSKRFFKTFEHTMPVRQFTVKMALDYLNAQSLNRSGNAANKDRKNLLAAWNWGIKYVAGFPTVSPFLLVDRFPEKRQPRYVPSEDDFWKVYEISEGQDRLMLLTYLFTAARKSEIFRLKASTDLDFAAGTIRLLSRKSKDGSWEERRIPMVDELYDLMIDHIQTIESDYVFTDPITGLPFQHRAHWLKKKCDKAGVKAFDWHSIRHLTARILARRKVPSKVIQEILGHKNLRTTEIYLGSLGVDKRHLEVLINKRKSRLKSRQAKSPKLRQVK